MRGRDLLDWLPGVVLALGFAVFLGAVGIWGGSSFFVGFAPGLLLWLWVLIVVQREHSRKFKELDEAVRQGLSSRQCLRCGRPVKVGALDCPHCGFEFRAIAQ
jgi:hypothetical protein